MTTVQSEFSPAEIARARRRVRRLKGFYIHLFIYIGVIAGLAVLNALTSPHVLWVLWTAAGWGIGLLAHGTTVMAAGHGLAASWEERKVAEILARRARTGQ